jgi:hypothetical protein
MQLFKWQGGRQVGSKYMKMPLWYFRLGRIGLDAYILKYEGNTRLPTHTDPVENGKHWRLNIVLKGKSTFIIVKNGLVKYMNKRFTLFRPDIQAHSLVVSDLGCAKLSMGFVLFNKTKLE